MGMDKFKILLFLTFNLSISVAQNGGGPISIQGKISYERNNTDSIYFSNSYAIDSKYFENKRLSSKIENGKFVIRTTASYPQMYSINYLSERGEIPQRDGEYFIDRSTSTMVIDSIGECSSVKGTTHEEFKTRFIPFFINTEYDCSKRNLTYRYFGDTDFDMKLLDYTKKYPDSYVALWFLIERFGSMGHNSIYEDIKETFSQRIKSEKLWNILNDDFAQIRIKENGEFPLLKLKTPELNTQDLQLPKSKYILVDFWFNNCRPCLEAFPKMKELYGKFHEKGFEIVSISVDRTESIAKWQNRIVERNLVWPQYLDENGKMATNNKIISFPTTFLLDEHGNVIKKNLPLDMLEKLLESQLTN